MARGRSGSGLAGLVRKLESIDAERQRLIAAIRTRVTSLVGGTDHGVPSVIVPAIVPGPQKRRRRKLSAAGRKRLSESAKARWAKAKKAGQTRL